MVHMARGCLYKCIRKPHSRRNAASIWGLLGWIAINSGCTTWIMALRWTRRPHGRDGPSIWDVCRWVATDYGFTVWCQSIPAAGLAAHPFVSSFPMDLSLWHCSYIIGVCSQCFPQSGLRQPQCLLQVSTHSIYYPCIRTLHTAYEYLQR